MTTIATDYGTTSLDLSVNSVQIKARQGETIVFEHRFFTDLVKDADDMIDEDASTVADISTWTFEGGVRDGSLPDHLAMDVKKYGPNGTDDTSSILVSFESSALTKKVRANSELDFYFEVSANIPTGLTNSNSEAITAKRTVLAGVMTLAADLYNAPLSL